MSQPASDTAELPIIPPAGPVMIRFGPGQHQAIPSAWVESMLAELATEHEAMFKKLLANAALAAR